LQLESKNHYMQTFDPFIYYNGLSAAFYFLSCLVCGLHLRFGIFRNEEPSNTILSRLIGGIFLLMSVAAGCYILSDTFQSLAFLWYAGITVDLLMFCGIACVSYILYANNQPSLRTLLFLSLPFVAMILIFFIFKNIRPWLLDTTMLILTADYIWYGIALRKREKSLELIYSDPDSHSLKWFRGIIALLVGWSVVRHIVLTPNLSMWYCVTMYCYMTCVVLFSCSKVSKYGNPVTRLTQEQIENAQTGLEETSDDSSSSIQVALNTLMKEDRIYLNPNLSIEDVANRLGVKPLSLSAMLHDEMNTTFCGFINTYRIERAKELLNTTDDKIEFVGRTSGFNSQPVFNRTFFKLTGKTPSQWRNGL